MPLRCVFLTLLILASPALAQKSAAPPTVADIVALLEQHKPDPAVIERLRAAAAVEPDAGLSGLSLAEFLNTRAVARERLGLNIKALEDHRRAADLARETPFRFKYLNDLSSAELVVGNFGTSIRIVEENLARAQRVGEHIGPNAFLAVSRAVLGELPAADEHLRRSLAAFNQVAWNLPPQFRSLVPVWERVIENARGRIHLSRGQLGDAEAAFRKAAERVREELLNHERGAYMPGEMVTTEVSQTAQDFIDSNFIRVLLRRGKSREAELLAREMLQRNLARSGRYSIAVCRALLVLNNVLRAQGRYAEARYMSQVGGEIVERLGIGADSTTALFARMASSRDHVVAGLWAQAVKDIHAVRRAAGGEPATQRFVRGSAAWALALVRGGDPAAGLAMAREREKEFAESLGAEHPFVGEARGVAALALYAQGDRRTALAEFRAALAILIDRVNTGDEAISEGVRAVVVRNVIEGYVALLSDLHRAGERTEGIEDLPAEAFRMADALRRGAVQDALAASAARAAARQPGLGDLIRKEQDGRQEVESLYEVLLRLVSLPPAQQLPKVMADMRVRITALEKERATIYAEIEKRFPDYANLVNPRPAALRDVRAALRPGEAFISILSTTDRSFVWALNAQGAVSFHAAALGETALKETVHRLRRAVDPGDVSLAEIPRYDLGAAHAIYAQLLAPAEPVWGSARDLYVAASGALAHLPLAALATSAPAPAAKTEEFFAEYRTVPWLARKAALVSVPSASVFVRLRALPAASASRAALAAFGDPDFGGGNAARGATRGVSLRSVNLPRVSDELKVRQETSWTDYAKLATLPDTREELLEVAKALGADPAKDVFLGRDASRRRVLDTDLSKRRVVAFATHGLIPGDLPALEQPALALSATGDAKESPLLMLEDVLTLKLDADWVVLSACNTAAGDGQGAEALSGLGRGFFYAGTRSLLATHWPVETVSARRLVTGVFERYVKDPALSRAQSLNQAMLALIDAPPVPDTTGKFRYSYAHPLFWAPYTLIGDGGR